MNLVDTTRSQIHSPPLKQSSILGNLFEFNEKLIYEAQEFLLVVMTHKHIPRELTTLDLRKSVDLVAELQKRGASSLSISKVKDWLALPQEMFYDQL